MNKNKRAVTPVIATVLLIAIVVVAALIVFIWAKSFMKERVMKMDQLAETLCSQVSLASGLDGNTLSITNTGNIPVYQVNLKKIKDKESESENIPVNLDAGGVFQKNIELSGEETQIIITPGLLGKVKELNKVYMCDEKLYGTKLDVVPGISAPTDGMPVTSQCSDEVDNDGDGLIDLDDPGCTDPSDNDEVDYI